MEKVILVNENDNAIGSMEKMEAHERGVLHRAFSILLFNSKGEVLLQKRSKHKYHSGGLWTNTCCSHPHPDEAMADATRRKLMQEMGIDIKPEFIYKFIYKANLDHNLIEYEYDHVFTAISDQVPDTNPSEVQSWKYMSIDKIQEDLNRRPEIYTIWFRIIFEMIYRKI